MSQSAPTQNPPAAANGGGAKTPATKLDPLNNLRKLLEAAKGQIAMAVPKHLTAERMIRVALTAVHRTPALLECDQISFLGCVIQAAELGLELSGVLGQAYMIPRNNKKTRMKEATFQVGYRGFISLAHRSGKVSAFLARTVYDCDHFKVFYGTEDKIVHIPNMEKVGKPVAFYSLLKLKDGSRDFEVMSLSQVEAHRDKYAQRPQWGDWVWDTSFEEMAKKTVIRRLAKRAPVSVELVQAAVVDEYNEAAIPSGLVIDLPQADLSPPPTGRTQLTNGSAAHEVAGDPAPTEDTSADPNPPEPEHRQEAPPDVTAEDVEKQNTFDQFRERIAAAKDQPELAAIGTEIHGNLDWLGGKATTQLMELVDQRTAQLTPAKSKGSKQRMF